MSASSKKTKQFRIEQDLTIYTAMDMKTLLMGMLEADTIIELDLSHVSEMDTAGLQLLILAKRESQNRKGDLKLTGHTPHVLDVLDMCNMLQFFGDPVVIQHKDTRGEQK